MGATVTVKQQMRFYPALGCALQRIRDHAPGRIGGINISFQVDRLSRAIYRGDEAREILPAVVQQGKGMAVNNVNAAHGNIRVADNAA